MYDLAAVAVMPGDQIDYAGEVVKIFRFTNSVVVIFDTGVEWEILPHEIVSVDDVIVTVLDSELDFFLSNRYPVDTLPIEQEAK